MQRIALAFGNWYGIDGRDFDSFKCRRGVVGGWKDYFKKTDINYARDVFSRMPNPFYGMPS
jgi:hypothetical protein